MIQLSNLVDLRETVAANSLNRFDQMRAANISTNLAPGFTQGDALALIDKIADEVLPATARTDLAGQAHEFKTSGRASR